MAITDNVDNVSKSLDKVIKQLSQIDGLTSKLKTQSSNITSGLSSLGTGNPVMTNPATFSGQTGAGQQNTNSMGMPLPSFGGVVGGLIKGGAVLGAAAWAATPGIDDAFTMKGSMFTAGFAAPGGINGSQLTRVRASFGGRQANPFDAASAASLLTGRGIGFANRDQSRVMGESGMFAQMIPGMSLTTSAGGMSSLQTGAAGVSGRLMQYGLFTNNLSTGKYNGLGKIIDQLWARWYGSANAKVSPEAFEAGLMGGFVGRDIQNLFGSDPTLAQQIIVALRVKQKSNGMTNINFNANAKGRNSAQMIAQRNGLNASNLPQLTQMRTQDSRAGAIDTASDSLIKGFEQASGVIQNVNKKLEDLGRDNGALGKMYDAAMQAKGGLETLAKSTETAGALNAALGGLAVLIGSIVSGKALGGLMGGRAPKGAHTKGGAPSGFMKGVKGIGGGIAGLAASVAGGFVVEGIRSNTTAFEKGSAWDNIFSAAAYAGVGAGSGAMVGGGVPGAVVGTIAGLGYGIYNNFTDNYAGGGTSTSDSINARLSKGEYVINARAAQMIGKGSLDRLNAMGHSLGSAYASPAKAFANGGSVDGNAVVQFATQQEFLNTPYKNHTKIPSWGPGKGWDCSSFTSYVFKHFGVDMPAYSDSQYKMGTPVSKKDLQQGDLLFFHNSSSGNKTTGHVGIYIGGGKMVNAANPRAGTTIQNVTWSTYVGARRIGKGGATSLGVAGTGRDGADGTDQGSGPAHGTPILPNNLALNAASMANPMSSAMLGQGYAVMGTRSIAGLGSQDQASTGNPTSTGTDNLGGTNVPVTGTKGMKSFARSVLSGLGAPTNKNNMAAMLQWMRAEGGHWHNSAKYNPLNTTLKMPGSHSAGTAQSSIKAYNSWDSGVQATINTLTSGNHTAYGYDAIVGAFQSGSSQQAVYDAIYNSKWGTKTNLPGHSQGAYNITNDQDARLHAGETVLPAYQAHQFRQALQEALSGGKRGGDVYINVSLANSSNEEAMRLVNIVKRELKKDGKADKMRSR